jgi:hypothetical protein
LVIELEPGRSDGNVAGLDMFGQIDGDGRRLLAIMATSFKCEADGTWVIPNPGSRDSGQGIPESASV